MWFTVGLIFVVHCTENHLEDTVDSTAVQPDVQRTNHQSLYRSLLNSRQRLLHTLREVLRVWTQKNKLKIKIHNV